MQAKQEIIDMIEVLPPETIKGIYDYVSFLKAQNDKKERFRKIIESKNIPNITLPSDENGHAYINKELYPELYDWAVNG